MSLEPNYIILLALGADANDVSPDWTDVSEHLQFVQVNRGSPAELDQNNPSTCTVTLDNWSGDYDNENADSPYAGNLLPATHIRILAEFDGELYPRFDGFIDAVELDYPGEGMATATITATDGFKALAQSDLPTSVYAAEVAADTPAFWWRLGESDSSTTVTDSVAGVALDEFGSGGALGEFALVGREQDTAYIAEDATSGFAGPGTFLPAGTLPDFTVEAMVASTSTGVAGTIASIGDLGHGFIASLRITALGEALFVVYNESFGAGGDSYGIESVQLVNDGATHHLVGTWQNGIETRLYIDGVLATSQAVDTGPVSPDQEFAIGNTASTVLGPGHTSGLIGTIDEVAVYMGLLPADRVAAHAEAVSTPWNNDTPAQRAHRIADIVGWPAELRDFDTGSSVLQSAELNMPALDHLQKVADSEFGSLFISVEGALTLRGRDSLVNRQALAVLGDATGEVGYRSISFNNSDELMRNPVTVSRAEGVAQTVEDATNVARFYPHQFTLDGLYHDSDTLSQYAAQFFVSEYKDPKRRITGLSLGPATLATISTLYPLLLVAELGNVYDVIFRPPNVTLPFEQTSVLEGTSETWTPAGGHTVRWSLSPAYTGSFWELDSLDGDGLDFDRLYF